jgi:hypothetical protein
MSNPCANGGTVTVTSSDTSGQNASAGSADETLKSRACAPGEGSGDETLSGRISWTPDGSGAPPKTLQTPQTQAPHTPHTPPAPGSAVHGPLPPHH